MRPVWTYSSEMSQSQGKKRTVAGMCQTKNTAAEADDRLETHHAANKKGGGGGGGRGGAFLLFAPDAPRSPSGTRLWWRACNR